MNATVAQVFTAGGPAADPRNQRVLLDEYSRQRGQISAGGQLLAYSVSTNSRFRFLRVYPNPFTYAPVTGFYSLRYSSTGLERAEDPVLNGSDQRLFAGGWPTSSPDATPAAATSRPRSTPRCSRPPGTRWKRAAPAVHGARSSRWNRRPGRSWRWCPPSYDPNLLATHDVDEQAEAWQQLGDNPEQPLLNRAISETYPPGSTFKVITTAAALQTGATPRTPSCRRRREFRCRTAPQRWRTSAARPAATDRPRRCGKAFAKSCNTAFVQLGIDTGADALKTTARAFGLDIPPPSIPLQVAESTVGPISDAAALGMSSIGQQDVALTPLQNALVAATIANDGVTMRPYLVDSLKGPDLANIGTTAPSKSAVRCRRRSRLH